MIWMSKPINAAIACAVISLAACANSEQAAVPSSQASADKTAKSMPHTTIGQYKKPGASVDFSHDYSGASRSGQIEVITLILTEPHDAGMLALSVNADDGLEIYSDVSNIRFDMAGEREHRLDIQVGTPAAGKYYLNFNASTDTGSGQTMFRSFSVAFNVDGGVSALKSDGPTQTPSASGGLVIMDAEETIIIPD